MEQKTTSLETLFKEGFGLDWKQMAIGEAVNVSDKNVFVSSYSHEENKEVQAKVLKAVRKPDAGLIPGPAQWVKDPALL